MKKLAISLLTIFATSLIMTSCDDMNERKCNDPEKCNSYKEGYRKRDRGNDCGRGW